MELISLLFLLIYASLILILIYGWNKPALKEPTGDIEVTVSIIVAFRNEQKHLPGLIHNLYQQDFPKEKFEIIFINDHSSDLSLQMIQKYDKQKRIQVLELSESFQGKKRAIAKGVAHAKGDLVLFTDADCSFSKNWIRSMVQAWQITKSKLILGPVCYKNPSGFAQHFFNLDFMSLTGSGAAMSNIGMPIMGNAANMLVERLAFPQNDKALLPSESSGDDVFLVHHLKKQAPQSVSFWKNPQCIVETDPPVNIKEFIHQRVRWASKSKKYRDIDSILVASVVFLFNFYLLIMALVLIFSRASLECLLILMAAKCFLDFTFFYPIARFYQHRKSLWFILPATLLYPFYIAYAAVAGWLGRFSWKDRRYP